MRKLTLCAAVVLMAGLGGCSKAEWLETYNAVVETTGTLALDPDGSLVGDRKLENSYQGTYSAFYKDFSGVETIFGGTSTETRTLRIEAVAQGESGNLEIRWQKGDQSEVLGEGESFIQTIECEAGTNLIEIDAKHFTGALELRVQ
ncbi:hypothetical protein [uncultured Dubosiella sp.]|uniref:hypothetical protein n=1 Tax=uncultured Dubosiella sp. TaxID=1937011 RepID=UPI002730A2C3|nr:hypothetical protein [uncultured Dubosiella sp.]